MSKAYGAVEGKLIEEVTGRGNLKDLNVALKSKG
jgi:hypothetical protein